MSTDKNNRKEQDAKISEEINGSDETYDASFEAQDGHSEEGMGGASFEKIIAEKDSEIQTLKDLTQRRQADFENYKKRVLKQNEEMNKYALKDFALEIIAINDDVIRAVDSSKDVDSNFESAFRSFVEGVSMISSRIEESLAKFGIKEIDAEECEFDPNCHEAVEIEARDDIEKDKVAYVYQKGFKIDDLVIRSCKVRVAKSVKKTDEPESGDYREEGDDSGQVSENLN